MKFWVPRPKYGSPAAGSNWGSMGGAPSVWWFLYF